MASAALELTPTSTPIKLSELLSDAVNAQFLFELTQLIKEGREYYFNIANDEMKRAAAQAIIEKLFCADDAPMDERFTSFQEAESGTLKSANRISVSLHLHYQKYFAKVADFIKKYPKYVITREVLNEIQELGAYVMIKHVLEQYIDDVTRNKDKRVLISDLHRIYLTASSETLADRWLRCEDNGQDLINKAKQEWSLMGKFNSCYDALEAYLRANPTLVIDAAFINRYNNFGKSVSLPRSFNSGVACTFANTVCEPPSQMPPGFSPASETDKGVLV